MADKFRTGDAPLVGSVSYSVSLPDAEWFIREFSDLIADIAESEHWEQVGAVTVDEAVAAGMTAYWSLSKMIGQIVPYITSDPPANSLACDGAQYLREDYQALYDVLDPAFIVDEDNFIVPDLRGRIIIGAGSGAGLTPRSVDDSGGEESHELSIAEMPAHNHTDSGHTHTTGNSITAVAFSPGELPVLCPNPIPALTGTGYAGISTEGDGDSHENMPPWRALNYAVIAK